jgi:hypothetical protein
MQVVNLPRLLTLQKTCLGHGRGKPCFCHHIDCYLSVLRRPHTRDYRTRRDRTERRTQAFAVQLPALKDAYMAWMLGLGEDGLSRVYTLPLDAEVQGQAIIREVDVYCKLLSHLSSNQNSLSLSYQRHPQDYRLLFGRRCLCYHFIRSARANAMLPIHPDNCHQHQNP